MRRPLFTSITNKRAIAQNRVSILNFKTTPIRIKLSSESDRFYQLSQKKTPTKRADVFQHGAQTNASAALHARGVTCQSSAKCTGAVAVVVEISNVLSQNRAEGFLSQSNGQFHSGFSKKQTLWRKQYTNSGIVNQKLRYLTCVKHPHLTTKSKPTVSSFDVVTQQLASGSAYLGTTINKHQIMLQKTNRIRTAFILFPRHLKQPYGFLVRCPERKMSLYPTFCHKYLLSHLDGCSIDKQLLCAAAAQWFVA